MPKTLILLRHAHRDTSEGRERDNGLSEKGKAQAAHVYRYFLEYYAPGAQLEIFSSPSRRCVETVEPLAEALSLGITKDKLFYEQTADESEKEFRRRVRSFCSSWSASGSELTLVCSHGDWIPECVYEMTTADILLKKGGWAELVEKRGRLYLHSLIQRFDFVSKF